MEKFVIYLEEWDIVKNLDGESIKELLYALMEYVKSGEEKKVDGEITFAYQFMKAHIDRDMKKYKEVLEKRREAGRRGVLTKQGTEYVKKTSNQGELEGAKMSEEKGDGLKKWDEMLRSV